MKTQDISWLEELNPRQRQAVTYGEGPLLIVAGAGSGKTRTLAYRVAHLIVSGVDPRTILLLTFTRRASQEMLRRAASIVHRGTSVTENAWGGTFHAIANRLLRTHSRAVGLARDFTILDQSDAEDMINVIRHEMNLSAREKRFPGKSTCLAVYSRCVNGTETLPEVLQRYFPWCLTWQDELKSLFARYVERKQKNVVLDYDDLLLYWEQLAADPSFSRSMGQRFSHILVDEYQDTNPVQARILVGMRRFNPNITVVGDDAQSIYGFRGASVRNMLDFPRQFPGTTVITLDQNYRSRTPILETTNRVIAQARNRYTKNLWSSRSGGQKPRLITCRDETEQDLFVVRTVLEHLEQGIPLNRQAVLFRAGHLSNSLELELTGRNIPYRKYGGLRFLEAAHVKDLLAFLRILENPRDEVTWFRVLQLLEGMGPGNASRAIHHVHVHHDDPRSIREFKAPAAARESIRDLGGLLEDLLVPELKNPAPRIDRIRRFYEPLLEKLYENPDARRNDLESLEMVASNYRSTRSFLSDLALDPPTSTGDLSGPALKDEDWLVLSTIHSAKGCEWDVVIIIHAADGCLPSDMSAGSPEELEEELRLTYVAMTRAKDFLYVAFPLRYYHTWSRFTDHHVYAQRCRFLTEDVCSTFERITPPPVEWEREEEASPLSRRIGNRLRSRWE